MAPKKRGKKKSGSKRSAARKSSVAGKTGNAVEVLDSLELDSRHTGSEPFLRKLAEGKASAADVNTAIDDDSRLEPLRGVMTKIASGEKVTPEEIEIAVDSKNEPVKPLLLALAK